MLATASHHETLTFVVRLWREPDGKGSAQWRGRVEHVASHEVGYVQDSAALVQFIERWTGDLSASSETAEANPGPLPN
jgi:hypothetical protein